MEAKKRNVKIFIVSGKARAGKDTTCCFIHNYVEQKKLKVINLQFAYYIKMYAKNITNWDGSDETKPRKLLQELGTDIIRNKIDDNFFINRIIDDIKVYSYFFDVITISDARLPKELDSIYNNFDNVVKIKLERPDFENNLDNKERKHITEIGLDNYNDYNYEIKNDGTLEDLNNKVINMLDKLDFDDNKKKKKKRKKKRKIILWIFLLPILIVIGMCFYYKSLLSPVTSKSSVIEFRIENGDTIYGVGKRLEKEKIIKSFLAYKIYVKMHNINGYKAGIYQIDKSKATPDIIELLSGDKYKNDDISITFKEGINIRKIASIISEKTSITEEEFYQKLEDDEYIKSLIDKYWFLSDDILNDDIYYPLEGYLYPETYSFNKEVTVDTIIEKMLDQTESVLNEYNSTIEGSGYSIHELITLASIVEKEGIYKEDRDKIAGVFYNRLNAGMSLGSDVTTYYAFKVDMGSRDLTYDEIVTYNPYNTRGPKMEGKLPVGPIANFSKESFDAVIKPKANDYYYFVADKNGKTYFTKTYQEHQKVIKEIRDSGNWIEF